MIRHDRPARSGNVIPAGHVQVVHPQGGHTGTCQTALAQPKKPQITLIKEGDVVRAIEVICACGEVIRLDCEY